MTRRRVHVHEDLVLLRHRALDVLEPQEVERPVPVVNDRLHTGEPRKTTMVRAPQSTAVGAPRVRQQSTQPALLGAERFPDVSTALMTTSVIPMPCSVQ